MDSDTIAKLQYAFTGIMSIDNDEVEDIYTRYREAVIGAGPDKLVESTMAFVDTLSPKEAMVLGHIVTTISLEGLILMEP